MTIESFFTSFSKFHLRLWNNGDKYYLISIDINDKDNASKYQYTEIPPEYNDRNGKSVDLQHRIMEVLRKCGGNVGNNWKDAEKLIDNYNNISVKKPAETVSEDEQTVVPAESEDGQPVVPSVSGDGPTVFPAVSGDGPTVFPAVSEDKQPVVSTVSGTGGKQRNKSKRNLKKISSKKRRPL